MQILIVQKLIVQCFFDAGNPVDDVTTEINSLCKYSLCKINVKQDPTQQRNGPSPTATTLNVSLPVPPPPLTSTTNPAEALLHT